MIDLAELGIPACIVTTLNLVTSTPLSASVLTGCICYYATIWAIRNAAPVFIEKGLSGKDLLKMHTPILFIYLI